MLNIQLRYSFLLMGCGFGASFDVLNICVLCILKHSALLPFVVGHDPSFSQPGSDHGAVEYECTITAECSG